MEIIRIALMKKLLRLFFPLSLRVRFLLATAAVVLVLSLAYGMVAQMPNFNRFLKSKDIDIELHTAGQYKRTLTLLGENTEEGREKFREELNETHQLFKDFVKRMRPSLDIEQVATGEHWYGQQAVEKGLVDEINTSDEVILSLMEGRVPL